MSNVSALWWLLARGSIAALGTVALATGLTELTGFFPSPLNAGVSPGISRAQSLPAGFCWSGSKNGEDTSNRFHFVALNSSAEPRSSSVDYRAMMVELQTDSVEIPNLSLVVGLDTARLYNRR